MPYMKKTTRSGPLLEIEVYYAPNEGKKLARGSNTEPTVKEMVRINEKNSLKRQQRLAAANFSRKNADIFVTFTYAMPIDEEQVDREIRNLMDRLRRKREKKHLKPLRAMIWAEKQSCWHLHVLMNGGLTFTDLQEVWGDRGRKMAMSMADEKRDGFAGLIRYVNKEHKPKRGAQGEEKAESVKAQRSKGKHRWRATRNLMQPKVEKHEVNRRLFNREPNQKKGYLLMPDYTNYDTQFGIYQYAAYVQLDKPEKAKSKKQRKKE